MVAGLVPVGSTIQVVIPDAPIELPDDPTLGDQVDETFRVDGTVLFTEQNRY